MVDFFSHIGWSYVVFHSVADWPLYVFFGLLPDLLFAVPSAFTMLKYRRRLKWRLPHEEASKLPEFVLVRRVYWTAHSLVLVALLALLAVVFAPTLAAPIAGGNAAALCFGCFYAQERNGGPEAVLSFFAVQGRGSDSLEQPQVSLG